MKTQLPKLLNKEKYQSRGGKGRPRNSEYRRLPVKKSVSMKDI